MNIIVHSSDFPPCPGGIAIFVEKICDQLASRGHNVKVLTERRQSGDKNHDALRPYSVYRYCLPARMSSKVIVKKLLYLILKHKADVVLQGLFSSTHGLGSVAGSKLLRVPYTILVHGFDIQGSFAGSKIDKWGSRLLLNNATLIIANSQVTKNKIEHLGYNPNKIIIVNPGVDPQIFNTKIDFSTVSKKYNLNGRKVILTVSRLVAKKNHVAVLRALTQVVSKVPNVLYLIIGKGEEEVSIKKMVKDLNLTDNVVFVGYVEPENTPPYFAACDVFVMPSKTAGIDYESFGIVYAEANACGKPVIGGKSGGVKDAVIDGLTGLLVDPANIDEIANIIIRLLTDDEYAHKLGVNGRKRVEHELNWNVVGEKVERILKEVANGRTSR
jgi:phosphatidylinositol alpha-1,6-mannosyltransferase